jgi:archaemetzincin
LIIAALVTLAGAFVIDRCADQSLEEALIVRPPFKPPGTLEQRRALGPIEGVTPALRLALTDASAFQAIAPPGPADWLASQNEPGQSFEKFVASKPNRPDAARPALYLQQLGDFTVEDAPPLDVLAKYAEAFFRMPVKVLPRRAVIGLGVTERPEAITGARQVLTQDMRRLLNERLPADAFALLGLTMEDLYPGDKWNFVFGEASLTDRTGVYSFVRYLPAFYGRTEPDSKKLVLGRSCKVLAHETGHLFGMWHCTYYSCLMNGSNHLGELDARPMHLCPVCLRKLQWSVGFDVAERYARLLEVSKEAGFEADTRWLDARIQRLRTAGR